MALNTAQNRAAMLAFASPLAWQFLPVPDGSIDADNRAHLLHLYGGSFRPKIDRSADAGFIRQKKRYYRQLQEELNRPPQPERRDREKPPVIVEVPPDPIDELLDSMGDMLGRVDRPEPLPMPQVPSLPAELQAAMGWSAASGYNRRKRERLEAEMQDDEEAILAFLL